MQKKRENAKNMQKYAIYVRSHDMHLGPSERTLLMTAALRVRALAPLGRDRDRDSDGAQPASAAGPGQAPGTWPKYQSLMLGPSTQAKPEARDPFPQSP